MVSRTATIVLRGDADDIKQRVAGGTITPGHFVVRNSSDQVIVNATDAGIVMPAVAIEKSWAGMGIDTDYVSGEVVTYNTPDSGDEINALLAAGAAAIAQGDPVCLSNDGTVRKFSSGVDSDAALIGFALEAVDNSGGGSTARLKIEIR